MCLFKSLRFSSVWFHHFSKYFYIVLSSAGQPGESFHFFNLSSFGRDERMIKAQFRWFRKKRKFYPGSFHTPHFYKVNASCLLAFKDKSFSLFSYIVQETLWQCFGALTTKCTRPVSLSAAFDNRGPLTGILTFLKTNSDGFCLFVGGGVFSSLFLSPGGSVWGAGEPCEAMARKPHHLQIGSTIHTRMGSLQCHSNSKKKSITSFSLFKMNVWGLLWENNSF